MRLVTKLVVLLIAGICAILSVDGYVTVRREVNLFDAEVRRDARVVGQVLDLAIGEVWATQGKARALELIDHADREIPEVHLRWVASDDAVAEPAPHLPAALSQALQSGQPVSAPAPTDERLLYTYVPTEARGRLPGALELGESLEPRDAYIKETTARIAVAVGATVAVCAALALVLGVWVVGRPIHQLVRQARAIGAGELTARTSLSTRDELGELATEMNDMGAHLLTARQRLAAETEEKLRAVAQLRHADRLSTIGKLSSGVAHELGTPLNVVSQRAAMIERSEVTGDEALDSARVIREQASRMEGIIRQLLDFARRRSPRIAPEDLTNVASQTISLVQPLADKRRVRVRAAWSPDASRMPASVDSELLVQAVTNLLINAIHASPQDAEVIVSVDRQRATPPADVDATAGMYCTIAVEDFGAGISDDALPHIFEPFFTTKDVGEGTGLGLSVAYGIVRDHGGWIRVDTGDSGSRFTVFLPVAEAAVAARAS